MYYLYKYGNEYKIMQTPPLANGADPFPGKGLPIRQTVVVWWWDCRLWPTGPAQSTGPHQVNSVDPSCQERGTCWFRFWQWYANELIVNTGSGREGPRTWALFSRREGARAEQISCHVRACVLLCCGRVGLDPLVEAMGQLGCHGALNIYSVFMADSLSLIEKCS